MMALFSVLNNFTLPLATRLVIYHTHMLLSCTILKLYQHIDRLLVTKNLYLVAKLG